MEKRQYKLVGMYLTFSLVAQALLAISINEFFSSSGKKAMQLIAYMVFYFSFMALSIIAYKQNNNNKYAIGLVLITILTATALFVYIIFTQGFRGLI